MSSLARELLSDRRSRVYADETGRRKFRPRRVTFQTIEFEAHEMLEGGWLDYEHALSPPEWNEMPSGRELTRYALAASERFSDFWYRVFDVALARSLSGRGTEILRQDFLVPSSMMDIGIPESRQESSVPPEIHDKILREYRASLERSVPEARVYYLSSYLNGLTDDIIETLQPYEPLWSLKERRLELLDEMEGLYRTLRSPLHATNSEGRSLEQYLYGHLSEIIFERLDEIIAAGEGHKIEHPGLRKILYLRRVHEYTDLREGDLDYLRWGAIPGLPRYSVDVCSSLMLVDELNRVCRSAAAQSSAAHRLEIRKEKYFGKHAAPGSGVMLQDRIESHLRNFKRQIAEVVHIKVRGKALGRETVWMHFASLRQLARLHRAGDEAAMERLLRNWAGLGADYDPEARTGAFQDEKRIERLSRILLDIRNTELAVRDMHRGHRPLTGRMETRAGVPAFPGSERYRRHETFAPEGVGNPFAEPEITQQARELILNRLRPIRRTTSEYSLMPGHRHGAMTLNPVLKLWKDRVEKREGPRLVCSEFNTRETVACLLELAALADPGLREREIFRTRIVRDRRGREDLENLTALLLAGSCYPLREVSRHDFVEFRGKVIGEHRSPVELGVDRTEDAILTGGWYQKFNHTLYYPVGGDNGRLIRLVWQSGRAAGPPAFFFALGQYVHDCFEDKLIYYSAGETTFRQCIINYYYLEDKLRKNRGERTGRRKLDTSRAAIRFMFAVVYARLLTEALTGSSQSQFRHQQTEAWIEKHVGLPLLGKTDRSRFMQYRDAAREIIQRYD